MNWAHNNFTFTQIPPGFSKLTRLTYLNLSNANVAGQIPIELLYMTNLVTLDLSTLYFSRVLFLKLENPNLLTLVQNITGLKQLLLDGVNISTQGSHWCEPISSSLPYLQILSLSNCCLSGPIDSSLQKLQFLSDIRLSQNNLSALVLEIFADLPNLRSLHLCFSSLYGKVLEKIFQVSTLEAFDLSENSNLLRVLPQFPPTGSLHTLVLSKTTFSGTLPDSVGNLRVLSRIKLSRCNFSGLIPNSIANLTQLLYLDLSYNNCIVIGFSKESLPSLDTLDLSRNKLQGSIPSSFFELRSLNVLMLSFNNFSGTMQLEMIQRLQNLTELELSYNSLSIDASDNKSSLSSFPQLDILKMASCKLQRFLELRNQSRMIILELSANQISGRIPNWIWKIGSLMQLNVSHNLLGDLEKPYKFPSLSVLDLYSNQLHGEIPIPPDNLLTRTIPESICNASFLNVLDLSNNNFNGTIPLCLIERSTETLGILGTFPKSCASETLDISRNHLEGQVHKSLANCTVLEVLNFGNNNINDRFPCILGNSFSLHVLVLRSNKFHGGICNCRPDHNFWPKLQIIDLASNNFSGDLPMALNIKGMEMEQVKILNIFTSIDISNNNFQGVIPNTVGDLKSLYVLNASHNALTSPIPSSIGNLA
ncbi:hypothetical protein ACSBR2_034604 [Camellia fascicularis]